MPGLLEENVVVVGVVGVGEHDVGVAIDKAGEDGGLGEVDDVGAGGDLGLVGWGDVGDFVAVDDNNLVAEHFARADVEKMTGADVGVGRGAAREAAGAISAEEIAMASASSVFVQRRMVPPGWRRDSNAKTSGWADLFGKGKPLVSESTYLEKTIVQLIRKLAMHGCGSACGMGYNRRLESRAATHGTPALRGRRLLNDFYCECARVVRCAGLLLVLVVFLEGVGVSGAALRRADDKSKSGVKQQADEKRDDKKDEKKEETLR